MSHALRRGATLVATLTLALALPLLGTAPADAAVAPTAAVVPQAVGCGTAVLPCMSLRDVVCWEDNWCRVPVTVTPYAVEPIRVGYATKDGTALAGLNYEPAQGTVSIPVRATAAAVPVFVTSSRTKTGQPAYLFVTLFSPTGAVVVVDTATVTIVPRSATGAATKV